MNINEKNVAISIDSEREGENKDESRAIARNIFVASSTHVISTQDFFFSRNYRSSVRIILLGIERSFLSAD